MLLLMPVRGDEAPVVVADPALRETSGLAVSTVDPDFLWMLNDSGFPARLHLVGRDGRPRGAVDVNGAENRDWEDLRTFRRQGRSWLVVGDIGDNGAVRDSVVLYFIAEPALPAEGESIGGAVEITRKQVVRYPDGPRDCESMAVDGDGVWLLTKRDGLPRLYLVPWDGDQVVARFIAEASKPVVPAGAPLRPHGTQPTSMDFSADGRMAAVLTYRGVFLVRRGANEGWGGAFARPMEWLGAHRLGQAEALAFTPDGREILVTTEGPSPSLIRMAVGPAGEGRE